MGSVKGVSRRRFLKTGAAAGVAVNVGLLRPSYARLIGALPRTQIDWVTADGKPRFRLDAIVRLANDRYEQFQMGLKRHPFWMENTLHPPRREDARELMIHLGVRSGQRARPGGMSGLAAPTRRCRAAGSRRSHTASSRRNMDDPQLQQHQAGDRHPRRPGTAPSNLGLLPVIFH
jgi:hypothetical protein